MTWPACILRRGDRVAELYAIATRRERGVVWIVERVSDGRVLDLHALRVSRRRGGGDLVELLVKLGWASRREARAGAEAWAAGVPRDALPPAQQALFRIVEAVALQFRRAAERREQIRA